MENFYILVGAVCIILIGCVITLLKGAFLADGKSALYSDESRGGCMSFDMTDPDYFLDNTNLFYEEDNEDG